MNNHHDIEQAEKHMDEYLHDLKTIVNIDSGTFTKAGIDGVGRLVGDLRGARSRAGARLIHVQRIDEIETARTDIGDVQDEIGLDLALDAEAPLN